jgi:flagellar motor protein MotB
VSPSSDAGADSSTSSIAADSPVLLSDRKVAACFGPNSARSEPEATTAQLYADTGDPRRSAGAGDTTLPLGLSLSSSAPSAGSVEYDMILDLAADGALSQALSEHRGDNQEEEEEEEEQQEQEEEEHGEEREEEEEEEQEEQEEQEEEQEEQEDQEQQEQEQGEEQEQQEQEEDQEQQEQEQGEEEDDDEHGLREDELSPTSRLEALIEEVENRPSTLAGAEAACSDATCDANASAGSEDTATDRDGECDGFPAGDFDDSAGEEDGLEPGHEPETNASPGPESEVGVGLAQADTVILTENDSMISLQIPQQ